jgi:hypothetical protein
MIKAKPYLHVHMKLMLIVECLLDFVMLQLIFKDAWCDEDILHYYPLAKTQQKKGQVA